MFHLITHSRRAAGLLVCPLDGCPRRPCHADGSRIALFWAGVMRRMPDGRSQSSPWNLFWAALLVGSACSVVRPVQSHSGKVQGSVFTTDASGGRVFVPGARLQLRPLPAPSAGFEARADEVGRFGLSRSPTGAVPPHCGFQRLEIRRSRDRREIRDNGRGRNRTQTPGGERVSYGIGTGRGGGCRADGFGGCTP